MIIFTILALALLAVVFTALAVVIPTTLVLLIPFIDVAVLVVGIILVVKLIKRKRK